MSEEQRSTYNALEERLWQLITLQLKTTMTGADTTAARIRYGYFQITYNTISSYRSAYDALVELKMLIEQTIEMNGQNYPIRTYIGAYEVETEADPQQKYMYSEIALRFAKTHGTHRVFIYNHDRMLELERELLIEELIKESLATNQFTLDFQPIYSLQKSELIGFEALLRWKHHTLGPVGPAEFIPVAENSGIIHRLGEWVIVKACEEMKRISSMQQQPLMISINLSPIQLQRANLAEIASKHADYYGIDRKNIQFELTEYATHLADHKIVYHINLLRNAGFTIAIDDFGTGYSTLESLSVLPIQCVKLDQLFIKHMEHDQRHYAIVKHIIHLSRDMKVELVAEGVETKSQQQLLVDLGCQLAQGYHLSRPIPTDNIDQHALTKLLTI